MIEGGPPFIPPLGLLSPLAVFVFGFGGVALVAESLAVGGGVVGSAVCYGHDVVGLGCRVAAVSAVGFACEDGAAEGAGFFAGVQGVAWAGVCDPSDRLALVAVGLPARHQGGASGAVPGGSGHDASGGGFAWGWFCAAPRPTPAAETRTLAG